VDTSTIGTYTVYYNVSDASGNAATQITRTINVIDVTPPDITLIGDNPQTIEACSPYIELGATVIDPCSNTDISSALVIDTSTLDLSTVGTYTVTYNAMDADGNMAIEVTRDINIVDTTNPEIICASDITVSNDIGNCSAIVNFTPPIGTDSCPNAVTTQTTGLPSGSAFPIGTTTNTYVVSDVSGNTATCSFDITVIDTEVPTTICKN